MLSWIIIVGLVIAMYIIIYKYEKKMNKIHEMVQENSDKINKNREHINENYEKTQNNHSRLEEHHSNIERMWVTIPKSKADK